MGSSMLFLADVDVAVKWKFSKETRSEKDLKLSEIGFIELGLVKQLFYIDWI